jgi:hypothetical protein
MLQQNYMKPSLIQIGSGNTNVAEVYSPHDQDSVVQMNENMIPSAIQDQDVDSPSIPENVPDNEMTVTEVMPVVESTVPIQMTEEIPGSMQIMNQVKEDDDETTTVTEKLSDESTTEISTETTTFDSSTPASETTDASM